MKTVELTARLGAFIEELADATSRARQAELQGKLVAFAVACGIRVSVRALAGEAQGVSRGGAIELAPEAGTKTLVHELAHELLAHHTTVLARRVRELEAEAVAYT